jgi:hypothetical protein
MGKDSLLKSTSKKKAPVAKRSAAAKPKTDLKTKATGTKKRAKKITTPKKKTAASKSKSSVKAKATPARRTPKAKASKKSSVSGEKLILKKFEPWRPKKIFQVIPDKDDRQRNIAPAFESGKNDQETKRIRQLLFKKFDLTPTPSKIEQAIPSKPISATGAEAPPGAEPADSRPFTKRLDPAIKLMMFLIIGLVVLGILIIGASSSNRSNYYIHTADGAVEIWQGAFAPLGQERIILLPGAETPEPAKKVYTQNEIFSIVFSYFLDKADTLLEVPGMPDFEGIKLYLNMAQAYAVSKEHRTAAASRLNSIYLMTYLYKADVATSKGTVPGFETALNYLNQAAALKLDKNQTDLVEKKIQFIKDLIAASRAAQTTEEPNKILKK